MCKCTLLCLLAAFALIGCNTARIGVRAGTDIPTTSVTAMGSNSYVRYSPGMIAGLTIENSNNKPLQLRIDPEIRTIYSVSVNSTNVASGGFQHINLTTTSTSEVTLAGTSAMLVYNLLANDAVVQPYLHAGGALFFPVVTNYKQTLKETFTDVQSRDTFSATAYYRNLDMEWLTPILHFTAGVGVRVPVNGSFGLRLDTRLLYAVLGSSQSLMHSSAINTSSPQTTIGITGGFYVTL